jgi:DNA invertase Pin-like site-specific DNA recombinase
MNAVEMVPPKREHINPPPPSYKVPRAEWPHVVQRVAQGESLRQVARSYHVSYEAIRRILVTARRHHTQSEEDPDE